MKRIALFSTILIAGVTTMACGSDGNDGSTKERVNGTEPAVALGMVIESPEGRQVYIGAFDGVPSGKVTTDNMREFGNIYASVYDGFLYVWDRDAYEVIKYGFTDDLEFVDMGKLSFQAYGSGFEFGNAFASPTRALIPHVPSDKLIVWNPTTMKIEDTKPLNFPVRKGMDTFPGDPVVAGGNIVWPITSMNEEAGTLYPNMAALLATAEDTDAPKLIEDDRCLPGIQGVKQKDGDIFILGEGYSGNSNWWVKGEAPPACLLRIGAGKTEFDPDFFLNVNATTGSPAIAQSFSLDDDHVLLRVWDPETPLPPRENYWEGKFVSKVVDLADPVALATDFDSIPPGGVTSNVQTAVDGISYLEIPKEDASGNVIYELHTDRIDEAFEMTGGMWVFGRLR